MTPPNHLVMSQTAIRSIADHFAEQAERQPDAPALIWDGEPISYAELQGLADAAFAELEGARLPEDRPVGIRAKKSPEAIALILACLRVRTPVPAAVDRARARDARAAVRPGGHEPGDLAARAAQRERGQPAGARRRHPLGAGRGRAGEQIRVAAGRRRRRRDVHAHHLGLDRAAEDRPAHRRPASTRSPIGRRSSSRSSPGTVVANYAPLNFDLCLLDIWTTLKHGGTRRARRPGPRHAGRVPRRPGQRQPGERAPGGADALPPADRRQPRGRPDVPERPARDHHRGQDPAELAGRAAQAVPERAVLQRLRLHRDQRQPRPRVPRARRRQRADEHPGRPADPRRDRPGADRGRRPRSRAPAPANSWCGRRSRPGDT